MKELETLAYNHSIQIYINKFQNRTTFKITSRYYEMNSEIMKLLESNGKKQKKIIMFKIYLS